jgi:DNA-binding transcriptional LysR family regulator
MVRPASLSVLPSAYDDFLYAPVGESTNGALLTVLSVLARQNVDPWEEAADLSRLPRDTAARRLTAMITASPGQSSNQAVVADRLIALLPRRIASADSAPTALPSVPPVDRPPPTVNLMVIAIYIGVMVLSQWIAASIFEKAPAHVDPAPSPPSTLGEGLPSTTADAKNNESPR